MKKRVLLATNIVLATALLFIFPDCKKNLPNTPDPTTPIKYYHLEITFIRETVRDASAIFSIPGAIFGIPNGTIIETGIHLTKIDDYHFNVPLSKNPFASGYYCIAIGDSALYDGVDQGTCITGKIIKVRVVETSITYTLSYIVPDVFFNGVSDSASTMAEFFLSGDGTIQNPSSNLLKRSY